ncbi:hypothetical protein D9619_006166 [Psilocybe cf. subviscida]|uniref:Uncharacterized protein n=1 Tax=Psilocybe cf. subviscida TaxID=2480587 RepID=A0A8H5B5B1_9AGAR|nr:hypothetical protein D9619_006166 [Psilocybe cf. subviscida]
MDRLRGLILPQGRLIYGLHISLIPFGGLSAGRGYTAVPQRRQTKDTTRSYSAVLPKQSKRTYRHDLRTLRPDRFDLVNQPILDLSQKQICGVRIMNEPEVPMHMHYTSVGKKFILFPANTKGVFHFHHVPSDVSQSQIRFRLCEALGEFQNGDDLRLPGGELWNVSLKAMARAPRKYQRALALLQDEFPIPPQDVDLSHSHQRVISTFDPQKLQSSGQGVTTISSLTHANIHFHTNTNPPISLPYLVARGINGKRGTTALAYPPDTTGVFYYKQSRTAPTRLGELRFRICRDVQAFDKGTDLCLPSGQSWSFSSLSLYAGSSESYLNLRQSLAKEGLLEETMYPDLPKSLLTSPAMPLRVINDPFMIDLSTASVRFDIVPPSLASAVTRVLIQSLFPKIRIHGHPSARFFSGKAIVRFEEYPGLPTDNDPHGPLLALRFLELWPPVHRLSDNDYMAVPKEGELLMVRKGRHGEYGPWAYNPQNTLRKVVTDWIARSRASA